MNYEDIKIGFPLGYLSDNVHDWGEFCEDTGLDYYCMAEGADEGDVEYVSVKLLRKHGILPPKPELSEQGDNGSTIIQCELCGRPASEAVHKVSEQVVYVCERCAEQRPATIAELEAEVAELKVRSQWMCHFGEPLPDDWMLRVDVTHSDASIQLIDPSGKLVEVMDDDMTADQMLEHRVDYARVSDGLQPHFTDEFPEYPAFKLTSPAQKEGP